MRHRSAAAPGRAAKRAMDAVVAASALVLLAPLMAGIALAIRVTMGSPVLFRQVRPGLRGVPFEVVKFRTMRNEVGTDGGPLPDTERTTRLGRLLRRLSLDELPSFLNVLTGEMSLVGPRPLLMEYLPRYTPEQARRHEVRPGITGWAQIHGRRRVKMMDRFALDVWYIDNWSLRLDLRILALTVRKVIGGYGVEPPDTGPPDPFQIDSRTDEPPGRSEMP